MQVGNNFLYHCLQKILNLVVFTDLKIISLKNRLIMWSVAVVSDQVRKSMFICYHINVHTYRQTFLITQKEDRLFYYLISNGKRARDSGQMVQHPRFLSPLLSGWQRKWHWVVPAQGFKTPVWHSIKTVQKNQLIFYVLQNNQILTHWSSTICRILPICPIYSAHPVYLNTRCLLLRPAYVRSFRSHYYGLTV